MLDMDLLKKIYELWRRLEANFPRRHPNPQELSELKGLLVGLSSSSDENLKKISQSHRHLTSEMSLQHFSNFLLPIERLLDKSLRDDEFLITDSDRLHDNPHHRPKNQETSDPSGIPLEFALDNLRSSFNVGSIFRTADCLGAKAIHTIGYTSTPQSASLKKTAMGTLDFVAHFHHARIDNTLVQNWKSRGLQIIALETAEQAIELTKCQFKRPAIMMVGNERFGLSRELLSQADLVVRLPAHGFKNSLNVATALAVAGFEWRRQWEISQLPKT